MHTANLVTAWSLDLHDRLETAAEALGVGLRDLAALTLLDGHPHVTVEWLRARIGLSQPGTVRLVDRLADAGSVERSDRQGRSVGLNVTASGREVLQQWIEQRDRCVADVVGALGSRDTRSLARFLAASLRAQERERPAADRACRSCDWPACGSDCPVDLSVSS